MNFKPGKIYSTKGIDAKIREDRRFGEFCRLSLIRHLKCDWGDLDEHDKQANDLAIKNNLRILSSYNNHYFCRIWIITEADRSTTTILLPEKY